MRKISLVLVSLVALGCGGSPPAEKPVEPRQAPLAALPPPADERPVIVAFGDSLSAGHGVEPGQSFPDHLQKEIDAAGYSYKVVNAGISGDTTSGGLARVNAVVAMKPEIVIVELGGNDGLRGLPVDTTRQNLDDIVAQLKASGAEILLAQMTLPPNYGSDYIRSFEQIYRDLAAKHGVTLIPFLLEGVAGNAEFMQRDGIHPNVEGNRRAAANVFQTLEPVLKRRAR